MHPRPVGIEDTHHPCVHVIFPEVVGDERFRNALPLVIAAADADRVHMAPIPLGLRMHEGIAVDFARRAVQKNRTVFPGEFKAKQNSLDRGERREDGTRLVMNGRRRTGQVVNRRKVSDIGN